MKLTAEGRDAARRCVSQEEIERMRKQGVPEETIQQEYYVKWDGVYWLPGGYPGPS